MRIRTLQHTPVNENARALNNRLVNNTINTDDEDEERNRGELLKVRAFVRDKDHSAAQRGWGGP